MAKMIRTGANSKVRTNKNGSTSTYTRAKPGSPWKKTGGSSQTRKGK